MKFNFKKIASVLAGTVMLSSTLAFAAAANYPAPFVQNGNADVAVVYGSAPGADMDLLAVTDVVVNLQAKLAAQTATGGTSSSSSVSGGDSYKIELASTKFQLGKGVTQVVSGTVTSDNLPTLLADGTYSDDFNDEFEFSQKLSLANLTVSNFSDSDYKADTPTLGIRIPSASSVLNYTLTFSSAPNWSRMETTDLPLLGKTYYVLDVADNLVASTGTMTLLDSAEGATINEGETKTLTIGDKTYETKISFVGSTTVKLEVNGEVTKSLSASQTYKLSDGSYLGIKEINYNGKDSGISSVDFSIGKGKLKLTNGGTTAVQINDDNIDYMYSNFTNSTVGKLDTIKLLWYAKDTLFATTDSSPVMPGFEAIKLNYGGMNYPTKETIAVDAGNDDYVILDNFPLKDVTADIELVYQNTTNYTLIGKDSTHGLVTPTDNLSRISVDGDNSGQYFIASWSDGINSESYMMKVGGFTNENGLNKTTLYYKTADGWTEKAKDKQVGDIVTIGNAQLTIGTIDYGNKNLTITAGSNVVFNAAYTKEGMKVLLPWLNRSYISDAGPVTTASCLTNITTRIAGQLGSVVELKNGTVTVTCAQQPATYGLIFSEEDLNENKGQGSNVTVTLGITSDLKASVSSVTPSTSLQIEDTQVYVGEVPSATATSIKWDKSGSQDFPVTLTYHGAESWADVYYTAPSASVSVSDTTTTGGTVKELGNVQFVDTQAPASSNLIVVGGSCVNKVAAELQFGAAAAKCGAAWEQKTGVGAGSFLIESFARNGKVATLVAGFNAEDTRNAAKVLKTATIDTTAGKKYKSTSATAVSLVTA